MNLWGTYMMLSMSGLRYGAWQVTKSCCAMVRARLPAGECMWHVSMCHVPCGGSCEGLTTGRGHT